MSLNYLIYQRGKTRWKMKSMETDSKSSEEEDNAPLINFVNRPSANNNLDNDKAPDDT